VVPEIDRVLVKALTLLIGARGVLRPTAVKATVLPEAAATALMRGVACPDAAAAVVAAAVAAAADAAVADADGVAAVAAVVEALPRYSVSCWSVA